MAGTAHAILMLLVPLATLVLCSRVRRRKVTVAVIYSACLPVLIAFFLFLPTLCCDEPAYGQVLICDVCLWVTSAVIADAVLRLQVGAGVIAAMILLSGHASALSHSTKWTNGSLISLERVLANTDLHQAADILAEENPPSDEWPAGWVRDLDPQPHGISRLPKPRPRAKRLVAWHTFMTGLWHKEYVPQDYWFPGGKMFGSAKRLELRERP